MAAIYSNGGNRWNILGDAPSRVYKEIRYLGYIRYLWAIPVEQWQS